MNTPSQMRSQLLLTILLLLIATAAHLIRGDEPPIALPNCDAKCGDISIPYPFGMKEGCFLPGFQVTCDDSSNPPRAFLSKESTQQQPGEKYYTADTDAFTDMAAGSAPPPWLAAEIFNLSAVTSEALVYGPVTAMCSETSTYRVMRYGVTKLAENGPFHLSPTRNVFVGVGSPVGIQMNTQKNTEAAEQSYSITCTSNNMAGEMLAVDGSCTGWGCCVATMPQKSPNLVLFTTFLKPQNADSWETSPCAYGLLVESSWYTFSTHDLEGHVLTDRFPKGVPFVLDFAIGKGSCPADGQPPPQGYACVSGNSSCANANRGGYACRCNDYYHGNPYLRNGCQDINECEDPQLNNCARGSKCVNRERGYDCKCISGFRFNSKRGRCEETFPLPAKVTVGIGALVIVLLLILVGHQLLKLRRLYKQNGGQILEGIKNIRIYTKKQLKRITNNYDREIGEGQFGKVYKGTDLKDKQQVAQQVAVKKSIKVDKAMKTEFTDEVILQSGMRHKNIVRLLGCCLEMEVPMLVYEFVANGSLQDVLFKKRDSIPVDTRLRISIGAAEGLAYMHSSVESTIRHGDVKAGNILLDENFTPKISDFGTSKLLARGKSEKTGWVTGDKSYIDPLYMEQGVVSQKNDVYSFGIVLIELITRRAATYDEKRSYVTNFVQACLDQGARNFVDNDITSEEDVKLLEMVSRVAVECLKPDLEERPDMKQVEQRLLVIGQSAQLDHQNNYQGGFSPAPDDVTLFVATE